MRFRLPALLMILLAGAAQLAALPAGAIPYGKNKVQLQAPQWQVLTTEHFLIHYHDDAEELAVRAALIAEEAYAELAARLGRDLPRRTPLVLYNSHEDFAQTNISDALIGEGTGGFSEPLRNRVVLPYNGSHEDFVHVIRHELVHAFMFHMAFGDGSHMVGASFFHVPLWFAEGIAEWLSSGWDAEADMYVRDATINDYLWPLDQVGGFMVYKQGQAAMRLLSERYGPDKLVQFWWRVGELRSVRAALGQVYGLTMEDFNKLYRQEMRRRYWPRYAELEDVLGIARPLTDHLEAGTALNQMPALNPAGDKLVCFSDREGLGDLWLVSALDGRVIRRLGQSRRSSRFESFHSFRSSISFGPDGRSVALVAKSGNVEKLHILATESGDVRLSLDLGLDIASSPSFAPDGRSLVLVGTAGGRTDLYQVILPEAGAEATVRRLTDDIGDEARPVFSPDGARILFLHNPQAEVAYEFVEEDGKRRLAWARHEVEDPERGPDQARQVVSLEVETGRRRVHFAGPDPVQQILWITSDQAVLILRRGGFDNIHLARFAGADEALVIGNPLTNLLGGVSHLSYSARADRLVFSSFQAGGWDLFAADDFLKSWSRRHPAGLPPVPVVLEPAAVVPDDGIPAAVEDPEAVGWVQPYSPRLQVDLSQALGGGNVYYSPDVGLGMANVITLSDLLADHRMRFLLNFYGSFDNSDLSASYSYLKRRIDWTAGAFHTNNYYGGVFTGLGELLADRTYFKEQNTGGFVRATYPLDTFRRFDLDLQAMSSSRTGFEYIDGTIYLQDADQVTRELYQVSLGYTHDTALHGRHGPAAGSRWNVGVSRSLNLADSNLDRLTASLDYRRYWMPWRRNTFALHLAVAASEGDDPRGFVLGGPWTLRGYRFYDFETTDNLSGTRMALLSAEYRVPFIDYLIFGWPGRWGLTGIGGTTYVDLGTAWNDRVRFFGDDEDGRWGMRGLRGDFGVGLRADLMFLPLRFDWAWRTDLRRVEPALFQFSIGREF